MPSCPKAELVDFETGLKVKPSDNAWLDRMAQEARTMTWAQYFAFLARFPSSPQRLRARDVTAGEPFRL